MSSLGKGPGPDNDAPHETVAMASKVLDRDAYPAISTDVPGQWQRIVDLLAKIIGSPVAVMARADLRQFKVLVASATPDNHWRPGLRMDVNAGVTEPAGSGAGCYLESPLHGPDGVVFGKLCVAGRPGAPDSARDRDLVSDFAKLVEGHWSGVGLTPGKQSAESDDEQRFYAREAVLHAITTCARDAIVMIDGDGKISFWNAAAEHIFGWTSEEVMGKDLHRLLVPADVQPPTLERIRGCSRAQSNGLDRAVELRARRKDNSELPVELSLSKVEIGTEAHIVGIVRDVSERKRSEQDLRNAHQRLLDIIEFLPDATLVIDDQKRIIAWNRAIEEMTGVPKAAMLGKGDFAYGVPFYGCPRPILIDLVGECIPTGKAHYDRLEQYGNTWYSEVSVPSLYQGRGGYVAATAAPLLDPTGHRYGAIQSIRDITRQKRVEQTLRESDEKYRALFELLPASVLIHQDHKVQLVNSECIRTMRAASADDIVGMDVTDMVIEREMPQMAERIRGRSKEFTTSPDHYFTMIKRKDGEEYPAEIFANGILYQGRPAWQTVIFDITERKQVEQRLEKSREELRSLSSHLQSSREEERARIAREIHDEMGQMLTGLKLDLCWIEQDLEQFEDSRIYPILDKVVAATELTDALAKTVQRVAAELRPGILDKLGLVLALRHEAIQFQQRTGIRCHLHLPVDDPKFPARVATAFFRIFQECLTNVARHAAATEVEITFKLDSELAILKVQDNGKGIAVANLAESQSLGLLGMKERALQLGGELTVQAGAGCGTVVTLRAPRRVVQSEKL